MKNHMKIQRCLRKLNMCSCIEKSVLLSEGKIDEEPHENTTSSEEVKQHVFLHREVCPSQ